jgi:hypothetical protein
MISNATLWICRRTTALRQLRSFAANRGGKCSPFFDRLAKGSDYLATEARIADCWVDVSPIAHSRQTGALAMRVDVLRVVIPRLGLIAKAAPARTEAWPAWMRISALSKFLYPTRKGLFRQHRSNASL